MNFIRSMTRRPSSQSVRLMTSPERELFRDSGYDENFNEAVSMSAYVQGLYSDEAMTSRSKTNSTPTTTTWKHKPLRCWTSKAKISS